MPRFRRLHASALCVGLALITFGAAPPEANAVQSFSRLGDQTVTSPELDADPETTEYVVSLLTEKYPDMTREHALQVWYGQLNRVLFLENVGERNPDGYEGVKFDAPTNTLRVFLSNDKSVGEISALAEKYSILYQFEFVENTREDLELLAASIRESVDIDGAGSGSILGVGVDPTTNRVNVATATEAGTSAVAHFNYQRPAS